MKIKKSVSFSEAPPLVRLISDQSEARKKNTQTSEEYEKAVLDSKREDENNINFKNTQNEILNDTTSKFSISGGKTRKRIKKRKTRKIRKGLKRTRRNNLH